MKLINLILNSITSRAILASASLMFSSVAIANVVIQPGGGCANCGFSNIGNSDPRYDTVRFPPYIENKVVIYLSEDLSFTDPEGNNFYSPWENIEFDGQVRNSERTKASLIGVNWITQSLSGGFVRNLSTSSLSLTDTDLNTGRIRLEFLGSDNTLTLQNSSITIAGDSPGISSLAPMTIDVTGGSNSISNLTKNYNPTSLTLNIARGASLEFLDSGVPLTTVTADRLYFRTPVAGLVDGGTLSFNLSNVYFNTANDFRFINNAQLSLIGFGTSAEFENLEFTDSGIDLGRNSILKINNQLKLAVTDVSIDYGANFSAGLVKPYGTVNFSSPGTGSQLNIDSLYFDDGGAGQLAISGVSQTNIGYLYFVNGAGSSLSVDSNLNISDELYAIGNPQITLLGGANFNLLGASNPISSQLDLNINTGATFSVGRSGQFAHVSSANILNNGEVKIYGDYLVVGNTTMSGTGAVNVFDNGRILLRSPQSTLALDNPLTFGSIIYSYLGGELHSVLDGGSSTPEIGRILYGAGDIDLTRARSLTVSQQGSATASELDGKYFTVVAAQNNAVAGTLLGASSLSIIEGSNIPAIIDFQVVDLNTNGHPDLTLKAVIDLGKLQKKSATRNQRGLAQLLTLTPPIAVGTTGTGVATPFADVHHTVSLVSGVSLATALSNLTQTQWSQLSEQHGEPYASFMTVGLEQNLMVANMVMDHATGSGEFIDKAIAGLPSRRLGAAALNEPNQPKRRVWGDMQFSEGSVSAQNDLAGYDYQLGSLMFGTDFYESDRSSAGVFTGLGFSQMTSHDTANAHFQSLGVNLGLYGRYRLPYEVNVTAMAGLNYNFIDSRRSVRSVGSFQGGSATADYNSWGTFAGLRLDRSFELASDRSYITPVMEMTYAGQSFGAASEGNGGDLGFNIGSGYADALIGGVGFDLSHAWESQGTGFVIDALFRYEYDFFANANPHHSLDMQSQLTGYSATVYGIDRGAQGLSAGLGLTVLISDSTSLTVGYKYTDWSHGTQQQFGANLTVRW